ncbi:hypothetical protein CHARACLAT_021466 [Characodon lateralis]|uniref:Uncharacterized protein n=1 Tax=Characodon lateralis TaxID=208331 RepID=A0ABU7EMA8_9TELE|nr:hypothetical protein [Characodon lateralis]
MCVETKTFCTNNNKTSLVHICFLTWRRPCSLEWFKKPGCLQEPFPDPEQNPHLANQLNGFHCRYESSSSHLNPTHPIQTQIIAIHQPPPYLPCLPLTLCGSRRKM